MKKLEDITYRHELIERYLDAVDTQGICLGCHTAGYAQQGKCNSENILFHKRREFYKSFNCASGSS